MRKAERKGTQYTVLHTVKARADKGLWERATFYFPNWYYDMPQIMYSFLEQYDLSGKTIVPFVTSGASGFSDAISTIEQMEPDAEVIADGLFNFPKCGAGR